MPRETYELSDSFNRRNVEDSPTLNDYYRVVRDGRWIIIGCGVAGAVIALVLALLTPASYRATAVVLVKPLPIAAASSLYAPPPVNVQTEREIVSSRPVASRVIDELDLDATPADLLEGLTVLPVLQTELLEISYEANDAAFAHDAARSFAENYLAFRGQQATQDLSVIRQALTQRIAIVQTRLDELEREIAESTEALRGDSRSKGDAVVLRGLTAERRSAEGKLLSLREQRENVDTVLDTNAGVGSLVEEPAVPQTPVAPDAVKNTIIGLLLGLSLGTLFTFLRRASANPEGGSLHYEDAPEEPRDKALSR